LTGLTPNNSRAIPLPEAEDISTDNSALAGYG